MAKLVKSIKSGGDTIGLGETTSSDQLEGRYAVEVATLTAEQQTAWATYRNALRDLPANYPDVRLEYNADYSDMIWVNVTWPTKPE